MARFHRKLAGGVTRWRWLRSKMGVLPHVMLHERPTLLHSNGSISLVAIYGASKAARDTVLARGDYGYVSVLEIQMLRGPYYLYFFTSLFHFFFSLDFHRVVFAAFRSLFTGIFLSLLAI